MDWAKHAGDLCGRLEQVRAFVTNHYLMSDQDRSKIFNIIDGKMIGLGENKTPADRLADAVDAWRNRPNAPGFEVVEDMRLRRAIYAAVEEYRSTRNGVGQTMSQTFGSPPDPIKVARFLLDSLTGGALSSLLCNLRDDLGPLQRRGFDIVSLKSNLKALGEKINDDH